VVSGRKRQMGLTMSERKAVLRQTSSRYQKASKKEKGRILDEFVRLTGYNRKYASWILTTWGKKRYCWIDGKLVEMVVGAPRKKKRKAKTRIYDEEVFKALRKVWYIFDCPCGRRLVAVLRTMMPILYKFEEVAFDERIRGKLECISSATIDRLLKKEKRKLRIKGTSHTRAESSLMHQIPIRTFDEWDVQEPGHIQIDLVGHDGGNWRGDFAFSLDVTDVATGWTEPRGIRNRARKWTVEALFYVEKLTPFDFLSIGSDNDSSFFDDHLIEYCRQHQIHFTRTRPYRKNDNCFVEQKNNCIIRRYAGYLRYDTEEQLRLLNEIYDNVRLFVNFFQPSVKLIGKSRRGSKVKKQYDPPQTPYQRMMSSKNISQIVKYKLKYQFESLNPAELHRRIRRLQEELFRVSKDIAIMKKEAVG
jgi:hypothetical protein